MAHSQIPYPDLPQGEGLRALMAIRDHLSGSADDTACLVKDIWIIQTAVYSKVWPKEPETDGPIIIGASECCQAFGCEPQDFRTVAEEIVRTQSDEGETAAIVGALDWTALLMRLMPIIIELLKALFKQRATE